MRYVNEDPYCRKNMIDSENDESSHDEISFAKSTTDAV
jgi:hypothetical protein